MIIFKKGNIFKQDVEAIVNPVNCVGVMGAGLALQFKKKYPENFKNYKEVCDNKKLVPGGLNIHRLLSPSNSVEYIINMPTKLHWKSKSNIEDVGCGLNVLLEVSKALRLKTVAIPPLGCGLGGLDWKDVRKLFVEYLTDCDTVFTILEP